MQFLRYNFRPGYDSSLLAMHLREVRLLRLRPSEAQKASSHAKRITIETNLRSVEMVMVRIRYGSFQRTS